MLARASHCGGFSCDAQALEHASSSSFGFQALERRLNSCGARAQLLRGMRDLSGLRIKPMSPASAGGFFTTELPRKLIGSSILDFSFSL